jgi:hypothetical protein
VITAPTVRLDQQADRTRLDETITQLKPRLLVLDPCVFRARKASDSRHDGPWFHAMSVQRS